MLLFRNFCPCPYNPFRLYPKLCYFLVKKYGEEAKISIRNYRRDANDQIKKLEKNHEISEDDSKIHQEDVQDLTDKYVKKIEEVVKEKDEEIMHV